MGLRDPSPPDEPRFVLAAKHMVDSGEWLVPRRGRELYAHKPAPFMWAQALAYEAVGNWRIAFLLPSLLAGLGTLFLTWDLGRRLWGRRIGCVAGLALFATLQFGLQAKRAQIDMLLVFFTTLALWGLLRHLLESPNRRVLGLGAFAAGLGTVTKGVGFLPLLAWLPWWLAQRRSARPAARAGGWVLLVGFLAGAGVWAVPVLVAAWTSPDPSMKAYAAEIFLRQTGERYVSAWHHIRPAWYYLQVIATLWLPGALLLPWLLPAWWRRLRRGDARQATLLGWVVLVLLFFSASPGKREVYLLPALPAVCLAAAPLLAGILRRPGPRRLLLGYVCTLSLVALLLLFDGLVRDAGIVARLAERRDIRSADLGLLLAGLGALGISGLLLIAGLRQRAGALIVAFSALLWTCYGLLLAPALSASGSARQLMAEVEARLPQDARLGMVAWREQMLLQSIRPAADFGFSRSPAAQWAGAEEWLRAEPGQRWLLVAGAAMPVCLAVPPAQSVGRSNRDDWWLLPGSALTPDCTPSEQLQDERRSGAGHDLKQGR
ncbi:ArnT family glycosyltransferase [Pseudomarimonas salicorniae]|uniref:Glycosyltransferase family 39 protein n=1 Tax=Pseudomarimonas salicorniae TaxID=2933270 RepID=A0ABT0GDR9_9GAMM|nr:glycosyltransferase family 39 protein [Lysobacter sp. CAU 1642]MCK7592701.1 glycosyltransferase family 39 protein [Lysobacter sp. CAU 1642]